VEIAGARVIVTGGARGLGRTFALDLAGAGARVGVCGGWTPAGTAGCLERLLPPNCRQTKFNVCSSLGRGGAWGLSRHVLCLLLWLSRLSRLSSPILVRLEEW